MCDGDLVGGASDDRRRRRQVDHARQVHVERVERRYVERVLHGLGARRSGPRVVDVDEGLERVGADRAVDEAADGLRAQWRSRACALAAGDGEASDGQACDERSCDHPA